MFKKRLRTYPWVIAATAWSVLLLNFSVPGVIDRVGKIKGTDFVQFYAAGASIRDGDRHRLYDFPSQHARRQALAPGSKDTIYVPFQSPQALLAFAPLAGFSYAVAFGIWCAVIVLLFATACYLTWRDCAILHAHPREVVGCCAAFPGLYSTILHGQLSAVAVVLVATALVALRRGQLVVAGLALGSLCFKPHWALVAAAIFGFAASWRVVTGIVAAVVAQYALTWLVMGSTVMQAYWQTLLTLPKISHLLEPRPSNTLKGLVGSLVPQEPLATMVYAAVAIPVLIAVAKLWNSKADFEPRAASVVLAMILVSPHAFEYDLILLAPALLLLAAWIAQSPSTTHAGPMAVMLAVVFFTPMFGGFQALFGQQLSVAAMATLLAAIIVSARPMLSGVWLPVTPPSSPTR